MLVHICCVVDSHYFLQKLRSDYPDEKLIGFFYDPNIHPYSEYQLRLLDVKRSCGLLGIELIEGEYDIDRWLEAVKGLEGEAEKGSRCSVCFDRRFEVSAQKAASLKEKSFTSTLLTSPKKSLKQLKASGDTLAKLYSLEFIAPDYRKASGAQEQNIMAKESQLYRQDYCGCIYGLAMQREEQQKLADELFSPISKQIQPESIECRINIYEQRMKLEKECIPYKIIKERFLNWRLISGWVKIRKEIIPAHFLPYSTLKKEYSRGRIEYTINNLHHMSRDEIKFISLDYYNKLTNNTYKNTRDLIFNPPSFDKESTLRGSLMQMPYNLSVIVVIDVIPETKIELFLKTETYNDMIEKLIPL
ncbi:MAG: epoxyqueuosine reductase QueH [Sulfurovum sp.]|nr:epoxyqueuosine reductase QueH [Sulfurovum sp.]